MVIQDGGHTALTMLRPQTKINTTLEALVEQLARYRPVLTGNSAQTVTGISMNSKAVQPGDLYAAVGGARHHGADYINQAVEAGAVAVLTDDSGMARMPEGLTYIVVDDVRTALADAAALIYGNHTAGTPIVYGVTGTNGKTTTSYFVNALLTALEYTTGLIGTIETRINGVATPSEFTTPEAPELHSLVARMREAGVETMAMEVSSHAMDYRRAFGLRYQVAGFTNLTQDHLDLHGSMDEYFNAKALLFQPERAASQVITLNGGTEPQWGQRLAAECPGAVTLDLGPVAVVDTAHTEATWIIIECEPAGLGYAFRLRHQSGFEVATRVGMPGEFNVANAALAAVMVLTGHERQDWDRIAAVLADPKRAPFESAVPGRMEVICDEPTVIVDFAHNPDGLTQALKAVNRAKRVPNGQAARTILVFGATGDRDTAKRPLMGRIAAQHADVVIITDDDPHYEDPADIREAVIEAAQLQAQQVAHAPEVIEIAPRGDALAHAVQLATKDDIILAAGRGHETHQDLAGQRFAIDDRQVLRQALADHGFVTTSPGSSQSTD
ncbi:UDP-N-acetylmuramoyl-L-alanyl-D-glutamate--2,6-diaminopimelate ligase [Enteractinococcus coprophilus]|uniref:UDP-N-acetylmuramyl-tripeptide synthetase n=1 Tax=Enteractinococcus coprophilus TaxID=1027633 RepID=A0A543AJT5_9MICC|nr:UDP-N-acetylmuramoyl-L-alanyl-D-glutamate--2,6-diaminopimelate ligase [Enteractinococcus coprophilus]TQL72844.1 UDP-N-acetylmuramoylalanyl-D-glutamate--2,6-diaminopimelate ligase [Enteractinococcus coprophilus]